MSKFTPWKPEEMRQAASDFAEDQGEYIGPFYEGFEAGVAWAAAQIEKCETIHGYIVSPNSSIWSPLQMRGDTHKAKLVGVREVEK